MHNDEPAHEHIPVHHDVLALIASAVLAFAVFYVDDVVTGDPREPMRDVPALVLTVLTLVLATGWAAFGIGM
jgi:hypothetical protein